MSSQFAKTFNEFAAVGGNGGLIIAATTTFVGLTTLWILLCQLWSSVSLERKLKGRPPVPPGSLGLPIVGETLEYVKHFAKNKLDVFVLSRAAKYGRCFKTSILGLPTVIVDPPDGIKFLFANEGKLVENSWPPSVAKLLGFSSLTFKKGEDYRIARRHFAAFLSLESVIKTLPRIEELTLKHLAEFWDGQDEVVVLNLAHAFTFTLVADLCLSLKPGPQLDELAKGFDVWSKGILQIPVNLPGFSYHKASKARILILVLLDKIIANRRLDLKEGRATTTQDVLSNLLTQPDETGRINSDEEIKDNIMLLMFAGNDTSSGVINMVVMLIAKYPEVRARLLEEHNSIAGNKRKGELLTIEDVRGMKYTWRVLQETMRLYPPVMGTFREAITDFEYNGYTILKGWKLYWINLYSHMDPKYFSNPHDFDPSRFEGSGPHAYTYVPFGGGQRLCPGNEFAKVEMLVFLHHLVRNFDWSLTHPDETVIRGPFPRTPKGIPVKLRKISK